MKTFFVIFALVGYAVASAIIAPTTTLVRSPSDDSAIIHSERLGGNFAYSTHEGHAYRAINPILGNIIRPVGVSYQQRLAPLNYYGLQYPYAAPYAWNNRFLY